MAARPPSRPCPTSHLPSNRCQVSAWIGTCYVTPIVGAWLADTYMGRFWTILSFCSVYLVVSKAHGMLCGGR